MRVASRVGKEEAEVSHGEGVAAAGGDWCGVGFKWATEERWTEMGGFLFWCTPDWARSGANV